MPKIEEYAEVEVNGRRYRDWTGISVVRSYENPISAFTLSAASPVESGKSWSDVKLKVGDRCKLALAGSLALTGVIATRQTAYDARQHGLQVQGLSLVCDMVQTTPDQKKGEFKNSSFSQIARALLQPLGIELKMDGSPAGADKPFPRFSIHPGESVHEAIDRMMRMRNLFSRDDEQGRLVVGRASDGQSVSAEFKEGRNILSATAVLSDEFAMGKINITAQRPSSDQAWGDETSVTESVQNPAVKRNKTMTIVSEQPGDKADAKMRAQRELAENLATMVQVKITVQGWLDEAGKPWILRVGDTVNVHSPMLFPGDSMMLAIESATCRQDSGSGTLSDLGLVLPGRLGSSGRIGIDGLT